MADIKNLTVLPRPRSAWQAIDAGFTFARAHYIKLVILWLGFSLPIFLICALLQYWLGSSLILIIWWWFKPLYELPIVFYLSKALFSEQITMTAAWRMALSNFGKLFKTYLTVARLSTARALTYGVVFLEQLPRKQRAGRIQTLTMVPTRHYLLMLVCLHIEYIMSYAIIAIVSVMFFSDAISDFDWESLLVISESAEFKPWLLAISFTTLIGAAVVAPFYVSGGFLAYINRRMQLEAWDIEHRFRRIKPRGIVGAGSTVLLLACLSTSDPSIAENRAFAIESPAAVSATVEQILENEEFGAIKIQRVPKFDFEFDENDDEEFDTNLLDWFRGSTTTFAIIVKGLLWLAIGLFVLVLLYTVLQFRRPTIRGSALSRSNRNGEDAKSHPLTQNLPFDIVSTAEQLLKQGERRQALSVLFRGALRAVMDEHDLKVTRGATESDCKQSVSSVASELQSKTFTTLLGVWQKEAYGNQPQQEQLISALIEDWKSAFVTHANANSSANGNQS